MSDAFWRYEGPTWLVGIIVYAGWLTVILNHALLPLPVIAVAGTVLAAWHNSLVHESVHNLNTAPKWLKMALVLPPLGVWFPYSYYFRAHKTHHRDINLTDPGLDPESYYFSQPRWQRMNRLLKSIFIFNQTFAGRMIVGPFITVIRLVIDVASKLAKGDQKTVKDLALHGISLAVLFWFISGVAGMQWWIYIACIAYPGLALSLVRSFFEHRSADNPAHRTAIIESGPFFNLLFLYNNLHVVHHLKPSMPWYEIPGYYREHRKELHERNGGFVIKGYGEVMARYLFTPTFMPVHP